jgi:hypothetical protein
MATNSAISVAATLHTAEDRQFCDELHKASLGDVLERVAGNCLAKKLVMRYIERGHRQHEQFEDDRSAAVKWNTKRKVAYAARDAADSATPHQTETHHTDGSDPMTNSFGIAPEESKTSTDNAGDLSTALPVCEVHLGGGDSMTYSSGSAHEESSK